MNEVVRVHLGQSFELPDDLLPKRLLNHLRLPQ